MKIFSKFKQFSKDIKLIIITALIMSSFMVYAAGECIIAATADDVTYNGTTVQEAIDELYARSNDYCPDGYECNRRTMYTIMKKNAVLDNISSTYVTSSTGIDFSQISSDTNGKGVYEIASTKNDTYPIYYYRGAVDNNNIKFAGFCWKAVRTTDTGGVKMIYNGKLDGSGNCTSTSNANIKNSSFNSNDDSPAYVGYMYGTVYETTQKERSELTTPYVFGNDVTYSDGAYTLTNTMTTTGTWKNDYNTLNNHHYTCWTTGTICNSVFYVYQTSYTTYSHSWEGAYYITLTNGKKVDNILDEMFTNKTDSTIKTTIDNWYSNYLTSYTNYIEDTVYCNDRSISDPVGWNPAGGDTTTGLSFEQRNRIDNYSPSLVCNRLLDRFTVSSSIGNGALTYPIGLLSGDEVMYAGGTKLLENTTYYLYKYGWILGARVFSYGYPSLFRISNGELFYQQGNPSASNAVIPVISLKSTDIVESGDGTSTNPYVIKTN